MAFRITSCHILVPGKNRKHISRFDLTVLWRPPMAISQCGWPLQASYGCMLMLLVWMLIQNPVPNTTPPKRMPQRQKQNHFWDIFGILWMNVYSYQGITVSWWFFMVGLVNISLLLIFLFWRAAWPLSGPSPHNSTTYIFLKQYTSYLNNTLIE